MRVGWLHGWVLGALLSCAACGDESPDDKGDLELDATVVATSKSRVGPKGGVIELSDKSARVEIPEGALSKEIEVAVAEVSNPPPFAMGREKSGRAFAFTPHGTIFEKEVTITVDFEGAEDGIHLTKLEDDKDTTWTQVDSTPVSKQLISKSKSFSIYCAARFVDASGDADASAGGSDDADLDAGMGDASTTRDDPTDGMRDAAITITP